MLLRALRWWAHQWHRREHAGAHEGGGQALIGQANNMSRTNHLTIRIYRHGTFNIHSNQPESQRRLCTYTHVVLYLRKRVRQAKNAINRTTIVASWAFRRSGGSGRNSIRVCLKIRRNQMIFYIQYGFRTYTSSLPLIYYVAPQYKQVSGSLVCFALL